MLQGDLKKGGRPGPSAMFLRISLLEALQNDSKSLIPCRQRVFGAQKAPGALRGELDEDEDKELYAISL